MKLGEVVVIHVYQNQMKNKKVLLIAPIFCSEFQSVSRIVKIAHSVMVAGLRKVPLSI